MLISCLGPVASECVRYGSQWSKISGRGNEEMTDITCGFPGLSCTAMSGVIESDDHGFIVA